MEEEISDLEYTRNYYKMEYARLQKDSDILHKMLDNNPDLKIEYRQAKREIESQNENGSEME